MVNELTKSIDAPLTAVGRKLSDTHISKRPFGAVYNEDCLETMRWLDENTIDLAITSPPYDEMRAYSGNNFNQFEEIAHKLYRVLKPGGVLVWVIGDQTIKGSETGTSFRHALYFRDEVGFNLSDTIIYLKPPRGAVGNNKTYWQTFEYMFVLSKGAPKTINLIMDRENKNSRNGDQSTKRLHDGTLKNVKREGYAKHGRRTNVWQYLIGKGHSTKDAVAFQHPAIFPKIWRGTILSHGAMRGMLSMTHLWEAGQRQRWLSKRVVNG